MICNWKFNWSTSGYDFAQPDKKWGTMLLLRDTMLRVIIFLKSNNEKYVSRKWTAWLKLRWPHHYIYVQPSDSRYLNPIIQPLTYIFINKVGIIFLNICMKRRYANHSFVIYSFKKCSQYRVFKIIIAVFVLNLEIAPVTVI